MPTTWWRPQVRSTPRHRSPDPRFVTISVFLSLFLSEPSEALDCIMLLAAIPHVIRRFSATESRQNEGTASLSLSLSLVSVYPYEVGNCRRTGRTETVAHGFEGSEMNGKETLLFCCRFLSETICRWERKNSSKEKSTKGKSFRGQMYSRS